MKKSILILMLIALTGTLALSIASCTEDIDIASSEEISNSVVTTEVSSEETSSYEDTSSYDKAARSRVESFIAKKEALNALLYGEGPIEPTMPDELPVYKEGSIKLWPHDKAYNGPVNRKYRNTFYAAPCDQWYLELFEMRKTKENKDVNNPFYQWHVDNQRDPSQEYEEMYVVSIIKEFNVTREEMEVLLERNRNDSLYDEEDYNTDEMSEEPNLDIIYTLDNDIINEYYRYA